MELSRGRVLVVDLETGSSSVQEMGRQERRMFLGGRGFGAKVLWEAANQGATGVNDVLLFCAGALTGTPAPSSGRMTVMGRSPATGFIVKTSAGGHWGLQLRWAGWDAVVVRGVAPHPVYLVIHDEGVELRDARAIWGKDVRETVEAIKRHLHDPGVEVACIGPAGENRVVFASVMVSVYNAAARCGAGAVMGAKNLKAIAVRGLGGLRPAAGEEFVRSCNALRTALWQDPSLQRSHLYGTAGTVVTARAEGWFPSYNFTRTDVEGGERLTGVYLVEKGYLRRRVACGACSVACHRYSEVGSGRFAGCYTGGPEFETLSALGSGCGTSDMEVVIKANELCNIYGLDTISTGACIQWVMECAERGVLSPREVDGLKLGWGEGETILALIEKIARREGFGNILADGLRQAAQKVGGESWKWAVQSKGLEQSRVELRPRKGYALAFAVNLRGPDHLYAQPQGECGRNAAAREAIARLAGDERLAVPYTTEKRAEIVKWHEEFYAVLDSLGFCIFPAISAYAMTPKQIVELFNQATGLDMTESELLTAGERILTVEKCVNALYGARREHDTLPWRMMDEEIDTRPLKGAIVSQSELDQMLDEYYSLRGWDPRSSLPYRETLIDLGLGFACDCTSVEFPARHARERQ